MMLYGIGCGARTLLAFTDSVHRASGWVLSHGAYVLPEVWEVIGRTSKALRLLSPLIEVSHPISWAEADRPKLWVRTLLAGEQAAIVVVVNEDYQSRPQGFEQTPATGATLSFNDLPWLDARRVWEIDDSTPVATASPRTAKGLSWTEPLITDAKLYLVASDPTVARWLEQRFEKTPPIATVEGKTRAEDYLNGRRKTPPPKE